MAYKHFLVKINKIKILGSKELVLRKKGYFRLQKVALFGKKNGTLRPIFITQLIFDY